MALPGVSRRALPSTLWQGRPPVPLFSLILLSVLATTGVAHAQTEGTAKLTDRGRIMLGGVIGGHWSNTPSRSAPSQRPPWEAYAQPSVTYFVANRVGLGLSVGGSFGQRDQTFRMRLSGSWAAKARDYELWAGPDATLELPLVDKLSLLALPGVYYMRAWRRLRQRAFQASDGDGYIEPASTLDIFEYDAQFLRFALRLPLVFHLSPSVAVGLGPALWWDLFLSQDPRGSRIPSLSPPSPLGAFPTQVDPYPRTRLIVGLSSWLGGSF